MIPAAYLTIDKKHLIFADSEIIKQHGFAGLTPLYSQNEILKSLSLKNQWKPIETAPRDVEILVSNGKWQFVAQWVKNPYTDDERWMIARLENGESVLITDPTHWQPLPPPPKQ